MSANNPPGNFPAVGDPTSCQSCFATRWEYHRDPCTRAACPMRTALSTPVAEPGELKPDWSLPPGDILAAEMQARGATAASLTKGAPFDPERVVEVLEARAPLTPDVASWLELSWGTPAEFWLRLEAQWQEHRAQLPPAGESGSSAGVSATEVDRLRQILWDIYGAAGFDQDGMKTAPPVGVMHPDVPELALAAVREIREQYEQDYGALEAENVQLRGELAALTADDAEPAREMTFVDAGGQRLVHQGRIPKHQAIDWAADFWRQEVMTAQPSLDAIDRGEAVVTWTSPEDRAEVAADAS